MVLADLVSGQSAIISGVNGNGAFRKRITEMGFIRGQKITVIKNAPLKDPIEYSIMGYQVSLRRTEASHIEVISDKAIVNKENNYQENINIPFQSGRIQKPGKTITIGMVGNPNSGKTSIFNFCSNSKEHVGNYGGVTITKKLAKVKYRDYTFKIVDLPGTYSLSCYSPEEIFVRDFISDTPPDIIVNVIDSTNLERNLYLTTQLIEMNMRVVIALNMYDELTALGDRFDFISFSRMTGIPVVPTVGSKGKGLAQLFNTIIARFNESSEKTRQIKIYYGDETEKSLLKIENAIGTNEVRVSNKFYSSRFIAIKLLEGDLNVNDLLLNMPDGNDIIGIARKEISNLESLHYEDSSTLITNARYGFINGLLKETYIVNHNEKKKQSVQIDKILTHRFWGIPFFLFFLWLMFQTTFKIGQYPMGWIDNGVKWISTVIDINMADGDLKNLLIQGIVGGIGGVIIFLPNILILFLFIAIMEDTGYMARAAFLMDKVMHKIGLHGKSFIPMVMGFGCNVPAILSTRIIESRNNRIITMLILPFMSCSARLPVYILIIGTFFPAYQGTVLFGLYLFGIVLSGLTAILLKKFYFRQEDIPFVMELPPYRIPTLKNSFRQMNSKAGQYLQKIGGIILIASIIIWGLGYYPKASHTRSKFSEPSGSVITAEQSFPDSDPSFNKIKESEDYSYLEHLGRIIEPVIKPLGFDWKMGVSLLAGIAGKEIVVSTLGVIYQDNGEAGNKMSLGQRLRNQTYSNGLPVYTSVTALSYLAFILIYFPCLAVVVTIAKESGSYWWSAFLICYTTGLAWMISFLIYQIGNLLT